MSGDRPLASVSSAGMMHDGDRKKFMTVPTPKESHFVNSTFANDFCVKIRRLVGFNGKWREAHVINVSR